MNEKQRKQVALFRYSIIAPVLSGNVIGQNKYFRKGKSRKIDDSLKNAIVETLTNHPFLSGAAIYRLLVSQGNIRVGGVGVRGESINEGTLRKYINDNQLRQKSQSNTAGIPRKKFEKEHINLLWTIDCLHGPYIKLDDYPRKHKVFLIAAIDDHSRMICARGWSTQENAMALEKVLKDGFARFGIPKALYCDNGSIFSSFHLQLASARLGIALIHSKPYDSPSRGKIERFFRTVRDKFLSILDLGEINNLQILNKQFESWLDKEYHKYPHSGIGQTPMERFLEDSKQVPIKYASQEELDNAFQVTIYRVVKNDSTISFNNKLYQCPPNLIGQKIQIRYTFDKPQELMIYQDDHPFVKLTLCSPR
ncbi:MAG: DDE-type integrase/transposase/recombinase, partial [Acidobacteria bacterium]|nr:DDE-type integrase/transposase/recombinase [Acidobacteriota bacterium]